MTPLPPPGIVTTITNYLEAHMWLIVVVVFIAGVLTYYALWGMQRVNSRNINVTNEELESIDEKI
jgi:carbon starvation protein CstA